MSKRVLLVASLLVNSTIIFAVNIRRPNSSTSLCPERDKCATGDEKYLPSCYCDQKCFYYMDCCKEYVSGHQTNNTMDPLQNHNCISLTNEDYIISQRIGAFMIDKCLKTNTSCKVAQDDPSASLPVSSKYDTYLNAECAICNGVNHFQYWDAFYEIYNEEEFEGLIDTNSSYSVTLDYMNKQSAYDVGIYMHPPANIEPRFCPIDIPRNKKDVKTELYQNAVYCNYALFKNIDTCKKNGCCIVSRFKECYEFYLPLYHEDHFGRGSIDTLQIILAMDEKEILEEDSPMVVGKRSWTLKYKYAKVYLLLEMYSEKNETSPDVDACIHGLMLYLQTTVYTLQSIAPTYYTRTLYNGNQVLMDYFRSQTSLTLAQMTSLDKLETEIQCKDIFSNLVMSGRLRKATPSDAIAIPQMTSDIKAPRQIRLNMFTLADPKMNEVCEGISLDITKTNDRANVHVECNVDNKAKAKTNIATQFTSSLIEILIAVTISFLCY